MSQKLPANSFQWMEGTSQFIGVQYPEKLHELYNDLSFSPNGIKIEISKRLLLIYIIKLNMFFT